MELMSAKKIYNFDKEIGTPPGTFLSALIQEDSLVCVLEYFINFFDIPWRSRIG